VKHERELAAAPAGAENHTECRTSRVFTLPRHNYNNAFYEYLMGKRIRQYPITPDKIMMV